MANNIVNGSFPLSEKIVLDLLRLASKPDRSIFYRMRRMGYSSFDACRVAIFHSKIGMGDFKNTNEINRWLDDIEEEMDHRLYSALMRPCFPCKSPSTYHPLQEDRCDPSYYWN